MVYRTQNIPVLADEGKIGVTEEEKAEMLAYTFQKSSIYKGIIQIILQNQK